MDEQSADPCRADNRLVGSGPRCPAARRDHLTPCTSHANIGANAPQTWFASHSR
jgi:hypothetical protein